MRYNSFNETYSIAKHSKGGNMIFGLGGIGCSREKIFISYSRDDKHTDNITDDLLNSFRRTSTSFMDIITCATKDILRNLINISTCVWCGFIDTRAADLDVNSYSLRTVTKRLTERREAKLKNTINRFEAAFRHFARNFVSARLSGTNNFGNSPKKNVLSDLSNNSIGVRNISCANKILSRSCRRIEKVKLKFVSLFSASDIPRYALKVPSENNILQTCEIILKQLSFRQFSLKSFPMSAYRRQAVGLTTYYASKRKNFKGRKTIPMRLVSMRLVPMRLITG